eukprot:gene6114-biopygen13512
MATFADHERCGYVFRYVRDPKNKSKFSILCKYDGECLRVAWDVFADHERVGCVFDTAQIDIDGILVRVVDHESALPAVALVAARLAVGRVPQATDL